MLAGTASIPLGSVIAVGLTTGPALLLLLVAHRYRRRIRPLARAVVVPVATGLVVLAIGVAVNTWFGFYPTIGSLIGNGDPAAALAPPPPAPAVPGRDRTIRVDRRDVDVHLPPGFDPRLAHPVLVWTGTGDPAAAVDAAVSAGRMPPVVFLRAANVPVARLRAAVAQQVALRTDRAAWAIAGPPDGPGCPLGRALAERTDVAVAAGAPDVDGPGCPVHGGGSGSPDPLDLLAVTSDSRAAPRGPGLASRTFVVSPATAPDAVVAGELDLIGARLPGPIAEPRGNGPTGGARGGL